VNLDPTWLFLSLIPSGVGFVLFVYGRKQVRLPQLLAGIALMVYPFFTATILSMLVIGAMICGVTWLAIRAGW
jgi:multisubunit Na+/H+ antiporter MnhC subunit